LEWELVTFALVLPEAARRPEDPPKLWLVEVVDELLPVQLAKRSKSGFALPLNR
jgi:hypothetical protein